MLRLFGKSTIIQVAIILAALALMWARPLAHTAGTGTLAAIGGMILILLGGFLLNLMLSNVGLVSKNSLLPTLLYCIFMSATATTLTPALVANLIIVAILHLLLLRGTSLTITTDKIFGSTALISIASMIYLPMLTFLITYILICINYRLYRWREWMVLILGLLAPYILVWSYLFLTGGLKASLLHMAGQLADIGIRTEPIAPLRTAALVLLIAMLVVSIVSLWLKLGEKTVIWKKNAITVMLPTVSGLGALLYTSLFPVNLQFLAVPFALCGTHLFTLQERNAFRQSRPWQQWVNDILFVLLILAAIVC